MTMPFPKYAHPNSEFQTGIFEILRRDHAHPDRHRTTSIAAGRFFELDYLRRLKKRNETYFAMAAHDCFSSKAILG